MRSATQQREIRGLAQKFLRAAKQRFTSAELLLAHDMALDAVYLAGYAVECGLKALILRRTPPSRTLGIARRIWRGAAGHNLEMLKAVLKELKTPMPVDVSRAFSRVLTWSTDLRYEVGLLGYNDAAAFLAATKAVLGWVGRSW